jgi:selenide,water dikinase
MARASNVSLRIHASHIPVLEGALDCIRANYLPGGLKANREFAECVVGYEGGVSEDLKTLLFDPQTAGGLLVSVSSEDSSDLLRVLGAAGVPVAVVGEVLPPAKPLILVTN